jgi:phage-related protein
MTRIPATHIADAHKLTADGIIELFEVVPAIGSGTFRFKADNDVTWRGNPYVGLPVVMSGDEVSADNGYSPPKVVIGSPNLDLSLFKPLVNDGALDGGTFTRIRLLLTDVIANALVREITVYEIRQVVNYTRTQLTLQLALPSDGVGFTIPHRQYLAPDFPTVLLR